MEGPLQVIDTNREEVTVQPLEGNKKSKRIRTDTVSRFLQDERVTTQPSEQKQDTWDVEQIIRVDGNPKRTRQLLFEVKWEGFDKTTLEPLENLQDCIVFQDFCKAHSNTRIKKLAKKPKVSFKL